MKKNKITTFDGHGKLAGKNTLAVQDVGGDDCNDRDNENGDDSGDDDKG